LSKIANDLRLLDSGPHTGLAEIELPAVQPGSSIMPGKVNPVMAEMLNMACFHVIGHDVGITMCGEAGQLELNVMMPYVAFALLESLEVMANATKAFDERCVRGIEANRDRCRYYAEHTVGLATMLNLERGYIGAAEVAKRAIESGKSVRELIEEERESEKPGAAKSRSGGGG
jgi:aspartate ammonia-lyase